MLPKDGTLASYRELFGRVRYAQHGTAHQQIVERNRKLLAQRRR